MAWRFNGQTDYASLAANAALSLPQNGSLGGWAYRADGAGNSVDYLLMHGATTANPYWFFAWSCDSAGSYPGRIRFYTKDSAGTIVYLYGESATASGVWHHVMATWDATALRLYIDGVMGEPNEELQDSIFPLAPNATLYLGRNTAASAYFPGRIAEWAKWDRALSLAEITVLAKGATPDWFANSLAWYLPMRKDPVELVRGIPVKLIGATPVDHPLHFKPAPMGWAARALGVAP